MKNRGFWYTARASAHKLARSGCDLTLLARGDWKETIDKNGLIIRHHVQHKTTVDRIKTIETLHSEERFDVIFVVMQYTHLPAILPVLAANVSERIVLVGNNPDTTATIHTLQTAAAHPKTIAFAFQTTGGRREGGQVISVHLGAKMELGGNHAALDPAYETLLREILQKAGYKLAFFDNMDAWCKCHLAFILPVAYACYATHGDLTKAGKGLLNQVIDAADEGYRVLEQQGYPILPPGEADFFRTKRSRVYLLLWIMAKTAVGKLAASDHAMSALPEMTALHQAFEQLKAQAGIPTPHWDALAKYMAFSSLKTKR